MISHWDQSKTPHEDFKEICHMFQDECPDSANMIFYSEKDPPMAIAYSMYCCLSNMDKIKLCINDDDLYLNFNIYERKAKIQAQYKLFEAEVKKKEEEFGKFITSIVSDSTATTDKDEILHTIIVTFKDEIDQLSNKFLKDHGSSMIELDFYACSIQVKKFVINIC